MRRRMQTNGMLGRADAYTGLWDCILKTARHEGLSGFYRGLSVAWLRCIPGAAIQFCVYDTVSSWISEQHERQDSIQPPVARVAPPLLTRTPQKQLLSLKAPK